MLIRKNNRNHPEIISINPFSLISCIYTQNEIKNNNLDKSNKHSFFTSYIQSRDVITTSIELSQNIPEEDLTDALEIKVYDELALDSSIEYLIKYNEIESRDTKNRLFNVFLVDADLFRKKSAPMREKIRYLDYITPTPLLFKSLYRKNILEIDGIHCFVYFQQSDAFLCVYHGGEYLYSKSLHYSLEEITEKFCELSGERIEQHQFYDLLTKEGLRSSHGKFQQILMQLFGEIFLYINDVLMFCKRSYNIESIDKIYFGSEVGPIFGLEEYAKSYLGLDAYELNFTIAIHPKEWYIDQIHILMILTAQLYLEEADDTFNFSIYRKPPPLRERNSGKLLGVIVGSLISSLVYPAYQFGYASYLNYKVLEDTKRYNMIQKQTSVLRQDLADLKVQKEKLDTLIANETNKFEFRKKILSEIYNKKLSYLMKASILTEIFQLANQNLCKVQSVELKSNHIYLLIRNQNEKNITEFIKNLTAMKKYKINTDKIVYDENMNLYVSKIDIGLRHD